MSALDEPQHADWREGHYYVSIRRGKRYALLAGPYASHLDALIAQPEVNRLACHLDPQSHFDAWGTARVEPNPEVRLDVGSLNGDLGLPTDPAQLPIPARLLPPVAPLALAWTWPGQATGPAGLAG